MQNFFVLNFKEITYYYSQPFLDFINVVECLEMKKLRILTTSGLILGLISDVMSRKSAFVVNKFH